MTAPSMNERALNRALLARQLLLERATLPAHDAIAHLIGLQSQAPHPPYTGLWSRLADFEPDAVSHGLSDRSLVRAGKRDEAERARLWATALGMDVSGRLTT